VRYIRRVSWREDRLHAWLRGLVRPRALIGSVGHDAAVLRPARKRRAMCVDQTIEGVHFDRGTPPGRIGCKAVGRAVSDLAASAARPREVLLALSAPRSKSERWMRAVISGVRERALELGAELVAGDLACAPGAAHLSVTACGEVVGTGTPPGRDRARPGQVVLLTGPTGGSRSKRHLRVEPRVEEGCWLHARGATAMMDVSDGLALDLTRLAAASRVRILLQRVRVHADAVRASRTSGRSATDHALCDGEDHELIVTLDESRWRGIGAAARRRFPALEPVGHVQAGDGLVIVDADGRPRRWTGRGGWVHG
jgi:thiamine-monophosphate kinase